ncbi:MAG: MATE family efflux transporter [Clostridia bacterium]|nr:MATE family efflux transporter [Clostridia bacterium]
MSTRSYEIDMAKGSIFKNIVAFALPLILGNPLQLFYNAADIIVVSRFAGSSAMASVGATGSLNALLVNGFVGISLGATVLVSRCYGARDYAGLHRAVHTSVGIGFVVGILATVVGLSFSKSILEIMGTPEGKVLNGAVLYMRIIFVGVPASMVYNFGAAVMRAVGDTKRPLYILAATGVVNVVLNLVLVIVFHMGVAGVAIATVVANYLSAIAVLTALMRSESAYKLIIKHIRFYKEEIVQIFKIGIPAAIQSMMFSLSNTIIQSSVNSFGEPAIAGNAAGANIEGFVYTAMYAFHQATVTSVSQNYGARDEKRVKRSTYTAIGCVTVVGFILGLLTVIFDEQLLGIYISDSPKAIEFGVIRILYTGLPYFLCGIMDVMAGTLRGLGYSTLSAVNSLVGACGLRILWVSFVVPNYHSTQMLFLCWPISWCVVIFMHLVCYFIIRKKAFSKMRMQEN